MNTQRIAEMEESDTTLDRACGYPMISSGASHESREWEANVGFGPYSSDLKLGLHGNLRTPLQLPSSNVIQYFAVRGLLYVMLQYRPC